MLRLKLRNWKRRRRLTLMTTEKNKALKKFNAELSYKTINEKKEACWQGDEFPEIEVRQSSIDLLIEIVEYNRQCNSQIN